MHHPPGTLCLAALLAVGCGAEVRTTDGALYHGEIVDGRAGHVTLIDGVREPPPADGVYTEPSAAQPFERIVLPGEQVADIDHPGNVLMVAGGAAWLMGAGMLVSGLTADPPEPEPSDCAPAHGGPSCPLDFGGILDERTMLITAGLTLGAVGAALTITGLVQYVGSQDAADVMLSVGPGSAALSGRF